MEKQRNTNNVYEDEIRDSFKRLEDGNKLKELKYFFDTARGYFDIGAIKSRQPKVAVFGCNIPEEMIIALGETPYYIIGGSLGSCAWADSYVPRDTDSVSKSMLGFLKNEDTKQSFKDSLIIVPITCDSMRKISYMLEDDFKIATVDFPPDKNNKYAEQKWNEEMYRLKFALEKHLGKKMSKSSLRNACELVSDARKSMRRLMDVSKGMDLIISRTVVQFVLNTYYFTQNIQAWTERVNRLCDEISSIAKKSPYVSNNNPNILIMGSPIYFPNFKIPFLLDDIHMNLDTCINIINQRMMLEYDFDIDTLSKDKLFDAIIKANYEKDCSQSYVNNKTLLELVEKIEAENEFDGVIYHVIKGQIEYDFELERYEDLFAKKDIPVFRLETDYNYQDIEQLRIRMEAFMEMIQHRLYQTRRVVS